MTRSVRGAICFAAQFTTMFAVMSNVHATMSHSPIRVAATQGLIGLAWVVNVNAVSTGGWRIRALYIVGGMAGAALATALS